MLPTTTRPPTAGHAEAIRSGDPEPGTFWRAREDVPESTRTEREQGWDKRLREHEVVARAAVPAGTLLLLRTVHRVDGRAHTLVTAGDPGVEGDGAREWLLDDFVDALEPVAEAEAEAIRAGQVDEATRRIAALQEAMLAIASEAAAPVAALPPPTAAATPEALGVARERATAVATLAQERSARIQAVNADLVGEMRLVTRLQGERASAALAAVQDALEAAERARKASESLDLFGGEAVEVIAVRDGEPAPDGTPVTLYQNRLFLDEELAVHLHQGGFDARDLPALGRIVRESPGVVDRMIPARRGVALVRVRRRDKRHFGESVPMAAIFEELKLQRLDREQFLLLRDGERLHLVFTETALQDAERLFPTRDELDKPFRGASGADQIRFDDTRFVKALTEFERQSLVYKRLLILLWGLEFGDVRPLGRIAPDGGPGAWHDPSWQERNVLFLSDDATRSLPDARPSVDAYIEANMAMLQPGSRVLVDWTRAITPDTAPSCAEWVEGSQGERANVTHRPAADLSVHTARLHAGTCVVDVPVRKLYDHYRGRAAFNARVELGAYEGDGVHYLVLDGLDEAELSHYCESRISRVDYLHYLSLFTHARRALADEFRAVREIDDRIAGDLGEQVRDRAPADVREAVRTAHRLWRAEHGGTLPAPKREREIRDAAFLVLTRTPTAEAIATLAGEPADAIVRAGTTGRGRLVVVTDGPDDPLLPPSAWTRRRTFSPARDGSWKLAADEVATLPREIDPSIAETIRSPAVARHVAASHLPEGISSPADTHALVERLRLGTREAVEAAHLGPVDPGAAIEDWYRRAHDLTFTHRPRGSDPHGVIQPWTHTVVGAVVGFRLGSHRDRAPRISLLSVVSDPLARALLADPSAADLLCRDTGERTKKGEPVYDGRLARLWQAGGLHRLEHARGRAERMGRERGTRDDGHPFWLSQLSGAGPRSRFLAGEGPTLVEAGESSLSRSWDAHRARGDLGDWGCLMNAAGIAVRSDPAAGEPDGRLLVRGDTWDWLCGTLGWVGERPANLTLVRL